MGMLMGQSSRVKRMRKSPSCVTQMPPRRSTFMHCFVSTLKLQVSSTSSDDVSELPWDMTGREEVEIPWWTYGARGMQLWFPSALAEPLSPGPAQSLAEDPELEFDREVYPIGISLSDVSVIGRRLCF